MIKILLVDDDNERAREISACISDEIAEIDFVTTKNEALVKMTQNQYDLAIVDIMLPNHMREINANKTAGIELIEEIESRNRIKPPLNIIGITSDNEIFSSSADFFQKRLIPILIWTAAKEECKQQITSKIMYLGYINNRQNTIEPVDFAIVTAVEAEFSAVKTTFSDWKEIKVQGDPHTYFLTRFLRNDGDTVSLLLVLLPEMGLTAASNMTTKIIDKFVPKKIFMVGICGGVKGSVNLGDIVIASTSWDYGCGKIKPKTVSGEGYYTFEASPNQISIMPETIDRIRYAAENIIDKVTDDWNRTHLDNIFTSKVHIGPMPSGASVICDTLLFSEIIRPQHRKCIGLDMETYGVYYAAQHTLANTVECLSIKSVSDFADDEKNDNYHDFCCYASANFLKECIYEKIL